MTRRPVKETKDPTVDIAIELLEEFFSVLAKEQ
jgi:hypothetical protein